MRFIIVAAVGLSACSGSPPESELLDGDGEPIHTCPAEPSPLESLIEGRAEDGLEDADAFEAELLDPERITVVTVGTGSPVPSDRAQTCTAVFVGGKFFLFDVGDRAQPTAESLGLPLTELDAIFVTHFHSDHIADLGEAISRSWIVGRTEPLTVYGPEGIEPIVNSFAQIYAPDVQYRVDHHGSDVFPVADLSVSAETVEHDVAGTVVYDQDGVVVRAFTVEHEPIDPALGYRVEYRGRSVGISGDTTDVEGFRALAMDNDVLVSEILEHGYVRDLACALDDADDVRNSKIFQDIRDYHTGAETLGRLAQEAGVNTLMLTHMVPSLAPSQATRRFKPAIEAGGFTGTLIVSEDGSTVVLDL